MKEDDDGLAGSCADDCPTSAEHCDGGLEDDSDENHAQTRQHETGQNVRVLAQKAISKVDP